MAKKRRPLQVVEDDAATERPVVARFANGRLSSAPGRVAFSLQEKHGPSRERLVVAAPAGSSLRYAGKHNPRVHDRDVKYLVAVHDTAADTWKVADAHFMNMKAMGGPGSKLADGVSSADAQTNQALRAQLVEAFGGRKKKASMQSAIRNKVTSEALQPMSSAIDGALGAMREAAQSAQALQATADKGRPIPSYKADATSAQDVYDISSIVPMTTRAALKLASKELGKSPAAAALQHARDSGFPPFLVDELKAVVKMPSKDRKASAQLLLFLSYLFTFRYVCGRKHGFTADDLTDKMEGVSEDVLSACLAKFASEVADESTGATKYVVSKWHQDLLVSHIIVLYMCLHNYKPVEVDPLGAALKLPKAKAAEHFRALGCRLRSVKRPTNDDGGDGPSTPGKGSGKVAELTIPFSLPQPRRGRAQ